jgi:hypothetical protein
MTSTLLNVYRCYQGHYMLQRGPVIDTVRGTRVHWLGVLEPDVLDPTLRHRIEHELEARAFALLTAAQFYDPNRGRHAMH